MASLSQSGPPVALFLPLAVAWFAFVMWVLSWVSGWRGLARNFGTDTGDRPESMRWLRSARLGLASYDCCLWVGGDERGLYLRPVLPLRLSHASLRIPWSEIRAWERKKFLFWWSDTLHLGPTRLRLKVPSSAMESLTPYLEACRDGFVQTRLR
ncbi:hypothetical protein SAMN05443572_109223 [Myxococcus fulvus]|uniref:YcxB-like protein domain-containing protein n=1 Tax=Myxococcus fulvus TaxID=33 RepID=A0A511T5X3_MYXFU|nr:hypothetical protein [Myxococcus fulvus]GEN09569.1 hypothetical protein MFU01_46060 [Myxococcus fulvus]SEU33038.1 hypothetical protein SAMN05443572_109223 [Myxococcus fulvus]